MRNDGMSGGGGESADAGNPRAAAARVLFDLLLDGDLRGVERQRALELLLAILGRPDMLAAPSPDRPPSRNPAVSQALDRLAVLDKQLNGPSKRRAQPPETPTRDWVSTVDGIMAFGGLPPPDLPTANLATLAENSPQLRRALRHLLPFEALPVGGTLLSGRPAFCERDGHFTGYRGSAAANVTAAAIDVPHKPDDGARLAHELRSPLNAIMGFAELIQREIHGPAPESMRAGAQRILDIARRLLPALDDLSDSARLDLGHYPVEASWIDGQAVIARAADRYAPLASERSAALAVASGPGLWAQIDEAALERLVERLLAAVLVLAEPNERFQLSAAPAPGDRIVIALNRPARLAGWTSHELRNPGVDIESAVPNGSAPLIGLGFALRLVSQLAERLGGTFMIEQSQFLLNLPALDPARVASLALAP